MSSTEAALAAETAREDRASFPYGELLWELTRGEVLMRDQGTMLGFLWTLLHPVLMFVVLYGLFAKWVGKFVDEYVIYLLVGLVLWNFFQKATTSALGSLRRARGTILNYRFPREIVVFSAVGAVLWSSLLEVGVLLATVTLLGQSPTPAWLLLPVILALELALVTGVGLLLAAWSADYQDLERIWDVLTSAMFYLTPVFYPLSILAPDKQALLRLNPLTQLIGAFRGCVIDGRLPDAGSMLVVAAFCCGVLVAGRCYLRSRETQLMDKLMV